MRRFKRLLNRAIARLCVILRALYDFPLDVIYFFKSIHLRFMQYMKSSNRAFAVTDTLEVIQVSISMLISSIQSGWERLKTLQRDRNKFRLERGMKGYSWIDYTLYFN